MVLTFDKVVKSFGEKRVLQGVSFSAESGKAFGLLGRNGAGKTTSLRILTDVFPADSGRILIDGEPIDYARVDFGYLPEERGLYPKKTVVDQLAYFAGLKGMRQKEAVRAVDRWLDRLSMREYRNKKLETLSKGNQQKIQLITALAHDPKIVILDEPFSGLDPVNAMLLKDVVREEIARDKIVLFSSHQMQQIEEFCDSIAILNAGKIVLCGDLAAIKRSFARDRLVVTTTEPEKIRSEFGESCTLTERGELCIRLTSPAEKQAVMRRLVETFDVDGVRVFEPSLSDIFVEYTTRPV